MKNENRTANLHVNFGIGQKQIHISIPFLIASILLLTALLYLHIFKNSFTNWDDGLYVLNSPYLKNLTWDNLKHFFSDYYAGNYHPLTLISLSVDYKLGGIQPWPYQLTNLVLHVCNTLLVFIFMKSLLRLLFQDSQKLLMISSITAVLFGIHTLNVESVAWISERKNVLYAFFFLVSLILYIKYLNIGKSITYILSIIVFILSLLSKGMAMTLSVCLILIDYFAGRNIISKRVILEKVPYFVLSAIFGYIAIKAQHSSESIHIESGFSWYERMVIAGYGFIQYLLKLCFPHRLSAYYPYPVNPGAQLPYGYYACFVLAIMMIFVLIMYFRRNKIVLFGTLFFLVNISIVLQLLPVGDAVMADRYVYMASIGFFFITGYCFYILCERMKSFQTGLLLVLFIYLSLLGVKTYKGISIWKDSLTMWNNTLNHFPENNDRGYLNRGNVLFELGDIHDAFNDYNKLIQIDPKNSGGYIGMGRIKYAMNDKKGAMDDFNTSLALGPSYEGFVNRAVLKIEAGDFKSALSDLDEAYALNRFKTGVYIYRGLIWFKRGIYQEAMDNYIIALQLDPENSKAYLGLARVKQALGDIQGAMDAFSQSLFLRPSCEGYIDRAVLKIALQDFSGAKTDLDNAMEMDPFRPEVFLNRGIVELNVGNAENALNDFSKAIELDNDNYKAHLFRAIAKINLADFHGALSDLNISIQLEPSADAFYYRGITHIQLNQKTVGCDDLKQSASLGNDLALEELQINCK